MNKKSAIGSFLTLLSWSVVVTVSLVVCIQFFYSHSFHAVHKKSNKSAFNQEEKQLQLVHTFKLHSNLRINRSNEDSSVTDVDWKQVHSNKRAAAADLNFSADAYNYFTHSIADRTIFFRQLRI